MTNCEILDAYESGVSSIELSRLTGLSAAAIRKRASQAGFAGGLRWLASVVRGGTCPSVSGLSSWRRQPA